MTLMLFARANEETLFVNLYPIFGTGWDLPVMEIDKRGILFEIFRKEFERAWSKAELS